MRVVLDTNTVVSALLFPKGRLGWIRPVWTDGRMRPLVSTATTRELIRVLAYPKFKRDSPFASVGDQLEARTLEPPEVSWITGREHRARPQRSRSDETVRQRTSSPSAKIEQLSGLNRFRLDKGKW